MELSKTLVLIKPDAVSRGMIGKVISRFEEKGLVIAAVKSFVFTDELLREHYSHLADKPFFPGIAAFMKSGLTVALCVAGVDAVSVVRDMVGVTNGREAASGTIRGDYSVSVQKNLVHASDSSDSAKAEVARFFPEGIDEAGYADRIPEFYASDEIK